MIFWFSSTTEVVTVNILSTISSVSVNKEVLSSTTVETEPVSTENNKNIKKSDNKKVKTTIKATCNCYFSRRLRLSSFYSSSLCKSVS